MISKRVDASRFSLVVLFALGIVIFLAAAGTPSSPGDRSSVDATQVTVEHHDGQTFVTWKDAAEGEAGAGYRYSLYRSNRPITEQSLASAKLVEPGITYNSAKLYGSDFFPKDRLDPNQPTTRIRNDGAPLPQWSGVAVYTAKKSDVAYYAVGVTDASSRPLGKIVPGINATTTGLKEGVAPLQPIKAYAATERAKVPATTALLGKEGMPLMLLLHGSDSRGLGPLPFGDYYTYFGNDDMGYRDGMPGGFTVAPAVWAPSQMLMLFPYDSILRPDGGGTLQTYWFGYYALPQWAPDRAPHAFPFTENRLLWAIDWTVQHYHIDPNRIYASGESMGGWGTATFAFRHPELFAAVFPREPRFRQRYLASVVALRPGAPALMPDGGSYLMSNGEDYYHRMDMVEFARKYSGELPFLGWSIGRHDGYGKWKDQVDMVHALEGTHRGFTFAWNDAGHNRGGLPMLQTIYKDYPPEKFRRNESYPVFSHSSIDDNLGNGDPEDGDQEGGINLGFTWSAPVDTAENWSTAISNTRARAAMTADVTPRRTQKFKLPPGTKVAWLTSAGQSGTATADPRGLVTVDKLEILPGMATTVTITRQ